MTWTMFLVGVVIGAVLGFGFGLVMLMPVLNQVSDLEDLVMRYKCDLNQMRDKLNFLNE